MDDLGGGCLGIAILAFIVITIVGFLIKYVILPLLAITLGVLAIGGAGWGIVVAVICIVKAVRDAIDQRKLNGVFRSAKDREEFNSKFSMYGNDSKQLSTMQGYRQGYESMARPMYLFGPVFEDLAKISRFAFSNLTGTKKFFGRGDIWFTKVLWFVFALIHVISVFVFGTVFIILSLGLVYALFAIFTVAVYPYVLIGYACEKVYYKISHVSFRCTICKKPYESPYYICPQCGILHKNLKPGKFGIVSRTCICGAKIPVSATSTGHYRSPDKKTVPITIEDLGCKCPNCGKTKKSSSLSKPISIALVGGASAGKTTFKVAFLRDFIEDESIRNDLDVSFPDANCSFEYENEIKKQFEGRPIPPTVEGADSDTITFEYVLSGDRLPTGRTIQLYDLPGEIFTSGDAKEGWNQYTFSEGAVFILDPFVLETVREENADLIQNSGMANCKLGMDELINAFTNTLDSVNVKKKSGKYTLPIAVTINKVDTPLLRRQIGNEAIDYLMKTHPEVFNNFYDTMDYVCRCFLAKKESKNFIATLDNKFTTVHYFYSSPMGYLPQKGTLQRFRPVNTMAIMQWLIRRADKKIKKAWVPELPVGDVAPQSRKLYSDFANYYDEYYNKIMKEE